MGDTDDGALRRFLACRDASDGDGARAAARELLELMHDRIDGQVAIAARRTHVPRDELGDVVQQVHLDLLAAVHQLRGGSVGELHSLIKAVVRRRCADQLGKRVRERVDDRPLQGEIDAAWEQHARPEQPVDAKDFLEWALPQLDRRQRMVLVRDSEGIDPEAISVALRITRTNLQELRRETNVALQALRREFSA